MNCTAPGSEPTTPYSDVGGGWEGIIDDTDDGDDEVAAGAAGGILLTPLLWAVSPL